MYAGQGQQPFKFYGLAKQLDKTFNRTTVECKYKWIYGIKWQVMPFNRTTVECK